MAQSLYYRVSDNFIKNQLDGTITDVLYTPCYNLSSTIGDISGKIPLSMVSSLVADMDVVYPGVIIMGETDGIDISVSTPLDNVTFSAEISLASYTLLSKMSKSDSSIIYLKEEVTENTSPLLALSAGLPRVLRISIKSLYLELFSLYLELLQCTSTKSLKAMTRSDISRMESNIRWISIHLENMESLPYDLLCILRDIHRTLSYTRSITQIYGETYKTKLSILKEIEGED